MSLLGPAMICAELWNVNIDLEKHKPFTAMDFLPGGPAADDDLVEFAREVEAGKKFEASPEELAAFKQAFSSQFNLGEATGQPAQVILEKRGNR